MQPFFAQPLTQAVILFTVTVVVIAIGVYLVGKLRGWSAQDQPSVSEALTKFREMYERGVLSDEEFRTIKTQLASQMQAEIKDSDAAG